jgi:pyrroline-5-carboxylate reductase
MGLALAKGWVGDPRIARLSLVETAPSDAVRVLVQADTSRLNLLTDIDGLQGKPDIIVLAVKPQAFGALADRLAALTRPGTLVVSIMAGITLSQIARACPGAHCVRAMPNTPGQIGQGVTGFATSPGVPPEALALAEALLGALGPVHGPLPEPLMPVVTGVSGSGPAYVFALVEALARAGEAEGLSASLAASFARQTVIGAAALLAAEPDMAPEALRAAVTSPGGTTQAALAVLMGEGGLPHLMVQTVAAAARRDRELSGEA